MQVNCTRDIFVRTYVTFGMPLCSFLGLAFVKSDKYTGHIWQQVPQLPFYIDMYIIQII